MSHFLSKFHFQKRPKSDQKHDQNTTKHDPTRPRIFEIFERATRHDHRNGWSVPTLALTNVFLSEIEKQAGYLPSNYNPIYCPVKKLL